jgi:acyl carrier protein
VLESLWPGRFGEATPLRDDEALGAEGLGLDSIEIVELVLVCQQRVGLPADRADELLETGPLTVGGLIDHLARA